MTEGEVREAAIRLELEHAGAAHRAAQLPRDAGLYDDSLNRLYYALCHVTTALLLRAGVEARRHRSLPGLLAAHFDVIFVIGLRWARTSSKGDSSECAMVALGEPVQHVVLAADLPLDLHDPQKP